MKHSYHTEESVYQFHIGAIVLLIGILIVVVSFIVTLPGVGK